MLNHKCFVVLTFFELGEILILSPIKWDNLQFVLFSIKPFIKQN